MVNGEHREQLLEDQDDMNESEIVDVSNDNNNGHDNEINKKTIFGYSLGHVFNDMCASMWFTYLLIYLEKVVKLVSWRAGLLMLIGQVTDALATPIIGLLSDSRILPNFIVRHGRRIPWHFIGFITVAMSFSFVFNKCLLCNDETDAIWQMIYYIPLIMAFQTGWACMQVNHLALISTIASQESCQRTLSTSRLAASVLANLTVFIILSLTLRADDGDSQIGPADLIHFQRLALIVVGTGIVFTLLFYVLIREPPPDHYGVDDYTPSVNRLRPIDYLKMPRFYTVALIYMLARLYGNVSQVYFPLYMTMTLDMEKQYLGIIPMVIYILSFAVYTLMSSKCLNKRISRNVLLFAGGLTALFSSMLLWLVLPKWTVFITASVVGISQALFLTAAFAFCNYLIDNDSGSGAFIYGCMSFVDKLANGVVYQIIEIINPSCNPHVEHHECAIFYRRIMVFVPGTIAIILALLGFYFLIRRIKCYIAEYDEDNQGLLLSGNRNNIRDVE